MCGPSLFFTTLAVAAQDGPLSSLYDLRSAQLSSAMHYECTVFDKNNACLSVAGRYTDVSANAAYTFDGTIIGGYRLTPNFNVGGYLGQGLAGKAGNTINVDNEVPLLGLYANWAQNQDGTGFSAHVAGGYQQSSVDIRREPLGFFIFFSEPGRGKATLSASGASAVFSYGVPYSNTWLAVPYAGLQVTGITRGGYTEMTEPGVTAPLTFRALTDRQTTAVTGVKLHHRLSRQMTLHLAGGLEHDLDRSVSDNVATSTLGASTATFGTSYRRTRAAASIGASYDVAPLHTITASVDFRQEALGNQNSLTGVVGYQVGF